MLILTWIRKIYKVLSADSSPEAIAFAAAFGLMAGFLPFSGAATLLVLMVLVFRVQVSSALLFWGIGALSRLAGAAVLFERTGGALLELESLKGFWTWLLNLPVVAWLDLHVYAVLGGLVWGLGLGVVVFLAVRQLVIAYRRWAHDRLSRNRFFRWLTSFWLTKVLRFVFVGGRER